MKIFVFLNQKRVFGRMCDISQRPSLEALVAVFSKPFFSRKLHQTNFLCFDQTKSVQVQMASASIKNMFAVICWNSKNGVALDSEELEVQSSSKCVLMNGGKQEVGAAVNMVFRKDIWGGIIQSIHDSKKDAEEEVKREISCVQVYQGENGPSKLGKRNRKRKSYGKEFEHDESEEELDATDDKEPCLYFPMPEKSKTPEAVAADNNPRDVVLAVLNGSSTPEPALLKPQAEKKLQHPHFGGKQPKQHKPLKCISTVCKEEKDKLAKELESTREELDKALEELSFLGVSGS
ncbi:uncharacterized protein LOC114950465 isoform X2 [Acropora millepora]|uniref:uncharacterized protein LOC114950465 isoform X2 n=1 Tax=Acropora millepora TaxID=45264 RepID=UPI001CF3E837|nr:uncharacterized protein LOC114950465 isoform X2 [Acropora millepora]